MESHSNPETELLLAQREWVLALARALVGDPHRADDVAQETLFAAFRNPPSVDGSQSRLRAWLAVVARRTAQQSFRRERDTKARELKTSSDETAPGADEVVQRVSEHRRVVDRVMKLDEPYRTALLLRFYEGLKAPQIAERTGASAQTIRKRISRGIAQLRNQLVDDAGGDEQAFRASMFALLGVTNTKLVAASLAASPTLVGTSLMTGKVLGIGASLAALLALGIFLVKDREAADLQLANNGTNAASTDTEAGLELPVDGSTREGVAAQASAETRPPEDLSAQITTERTFRGFVVDDSSGAPIRDVRIETFKDVAWRGRKNQDGEELGTSDVKGSFQVPEIAGDVGLWFEHEDFFAMSVAADDLPRDGSEFEVRLVPVGEILVTVTDLDGNALPDTDVYYEVEATRGSELQRFSMRGDLRAGASNEVGQLVIKNVPCRMSVSIGVGRGWADRTKTILDTTTRYAEVTVSPPRFVSLRGRVLESDGGPAQDIEVEWNGTSNQSSNPGGRTDVEGRFEFEALRPGTGRLRVLERGSAPLRLTLVLGAPVDVGDIVLEPSSILSGKLVSELEQDLSRFDVHIFRDGRQLCEGSVDEEGHFEFRLAPGPLSVLVATGGFWQDDYMYPSGVATSLELQGPRENVEIHLHQAGGQLSGRLPAGTAKLELHLLQADRLVETTNPLFELSGRSSPIVPDPTGKFESEVIDAGMYDAVFVAESGASHLRTRVEILDGEVTELGALTLMRSTLEVTTLKPDGSPAPFASVHVRSLQGKRHNRTADEFGRANFELAPGPHVASAVTGTDSRSFCAPVTFNIIGPTHAVELRTAPFANLSGFVGRSDGPVPDLPLDMQKDGTNRSWSVTTDSEGLFEFEPLEPGTYRIWSGEHFVKCFELSAGEKRELHFELEKTVATVRFLRDGEPFNGLTSAKVTSTGVGGSGRGTWISSRATGPGEFLMDLPEGPLFFTLDGSGIGNNQTYVFATRALERENVCELEFLKTGISLEGSAGPLQGPAPKATLSKLPDGSTLKDSFYNTIELAHEISEGGTVHFPGIPEGSLVTLSGYGSNGKWHSVEVRILSGDETRVTWP